MKKLIPIILSIAVGLAAFTGCQSTATPPATEAPKVEQKVETPVVEVPAEEPAEEPAAEEPATEVAEEPAAEQASGSNVKTGLGVYTVASSSKSAKGEANGQVQIDSVVVAVTLDDAGKIVKCSLDTAQTAIPFSPTGVVQADKSAEILTKQEKGDAYGMKKASSIGKDWYEQANALTDWMIGKTVAEVTGMSMKAADDLTPDVPELTSSVTVSVGDYLKALEKAAANVKTPAAASGDYKTGLGIVTSISSSKDATADKNGAGQVDSTIAAVTIDGSGKIVQCSIDSAQSVVAFNGKGEIAADVSAAIPSKDEKGEGYGMKKASPIGKEWNEQAQAFSEWAIGKTVAEVKGMTTKEVDANHPAVPDVPELTSSVTISVGEFIEAVEKAVANAK